VGTLGVHPASPEDLPNGFIPAESDECAEDSVYSVRATDDLVAGLGLDSAQPWLDRVPARIRRHPLASYSNCRPAEWSSPHLILEQVRDHQVRGAA